MQRREEFVGMIQSTQAIKRRKELKFEQMQQCVRLEKFTGLVS